MVVDPEFAGQSAQDALLQVHVLLGFGLELGKRQLMAPQNVALGVLVDIALAHLEAGYAVASATAERCKKIRTRLRECRARGSITPSEAGKLRGVLGFTLLAVWFRALHGQGAADVGQRHDGACPRRRHDRLARPLAEHGTSDPARIARADGLTRAEASSAVGPAPCAAGRGEGACLWTLRAEPQDPRRRATRAGRGETRSRRRVERIVRAPGVS